MQFRETRAQYIMVLIRFYGNLEYGRLGRGRFPYKAVFVHLGMSINQYIVTVLGSDSIGCESPVIKYYQVC